MPLKPDIVFLSNKLRFLSATTNLQKKINCYVLVHRIFIGDNVLGYVINYFSEFKHEMHTIITSDI